ncbi:MAG: restriction endonuclease subunit S [gamma proteobacterium symbiont of Bathyaustriella thionipta]|nr:restriction endonuclease subunit S [gamma proteobacterium symbiont of Bathyaustriella thionipta]
MGWDMNSRREPLGNYIQPVDVRNSDQKITRVQGISIRKRFIDTKANMENVSLANYKVVQPGQFAFVTVTSRNGGKISIAILEDAPCIVSSTYCVFEVTDKNALLPEFLYLWFTRAEFDRYARFHSWGSARETFDWDDLCRTLVPIPDLDTQQAVVRLYGGMTDNARLYEASIPELERICDGYMDEAKKRAKEVRLGEHVRQIDVRNRDLGISRVQGISIRKCFIDTKANMENVSLASYKVVQPGQFAYVTVTSRNGGKISIAMLEDAPCIVSSSYSVFEVMDGDVFLPEFLYLWFKRAEFDRYTRFHSWGSARETFDWEDMCQVRVPAPTIHEQESIVAIHHCLERRKRIKTELDENIGVLGSVLMQLAMNEGA